MIKAAVIGCGYWGPNIIRVLYEDSKWELKYCCDLDSRKFERIITQYSGIEMTEDSDVIFNDPEVQAVFIVTPLASHYTLAKRSLLAKKATFIEKPFVAKVKEGKELIKLARQNNLPLMVGHIFEYAPAVVKIKELLDNLCEICGKPMIIKRGRYGKFLACSGFPECKNIKPIIPKNESGIGNIYYISSTRVNLGIHRRDGSVIWDLASHDLGTAFYWLGEEPISIQAVGKGSIIKENPDIAFITLRFPSGVLVNIQVSWLAPSKLRNIVIVGSQKMIVYDDTDRFGKVKIFDKGVNPLEHSSFGEFQLSYRTGDITIPVLPNVEPLKEEINHFHRCIENGETPKTDGETALRVVKYLRLAEESLQNNGKVIQIPR